MSIDFSPLSIGVFQYQAKGTAQLPQFQANKDERTYYHHLLLPEQEGHSSLSGLNLGGKHHFAGGTFIPFLLLPAWPAFQSSPVRREGEATYVQKVSSHVIGKAETFIEKDTINIVCKTMTSQFPSK